jgi:peptide/nickel transport system substrate-binding protein
VTANPFAIRILTIFGVAVGLTVPLACGSRSTADDGSVQFNGATIVSHGERGRSGTTGAAPIAGGQLVVSVRAEPQSFNRLTKRDSPSDLISSLINARLVRINRVTQEVEPWLAESWTRSDDGLRYTVRLRAGVVFADGHPFTADDVVFTFRALYDERAASVLADSLSPAGQPLTVTATDPLTVVIGFAEMFGPGLRLLDNLPILPRHRLEPALDGGLFGSAWALGTALSEITGLGPFTVTDYQPGQRMVLTRNPRYFMKDGAGTPLPYLDRVIVEVVPDQNAELLQLESGAIDMTTSEMRIEDYAPLRRAAAAGKVAQLDLGPGYDTDSFWINLTPGGIGPTSGAGRANGGDPRAAWLQRDELRQAISLAVDRTLFADAVYLGAGVPVYGPVTPGNVRWFSPSLPQTPHDPHRALALLASIGLSDRNGDIWLEDAHGRPARFTLLTQRGRTPLERGAAVIRDELAKIGLLVDVVALDGAAVIQKFVSGRDYDAVYFSVSLSDTDPATNADYWLSSGSGHVWNIGQAIPATAWEGQIDDLMRRQIGTADLAERKQLFDQVQAIFAAHLPIVNFVAPTVYVAVSTRVVNITPALSRPQLLWAPDTVAVSGGRSTESRRN